MTRKRRTERGPCNRGCGIDICEQCIATIVVDKDGRAVMLVGPTRFVWKRRRA